MVTIIIIRKVTVVANVKMDYDTIRGVFRTKNILVRTQSNIYDEAFLRKELTAFYR